jgi:hypothetical protein
VEATPAPENPIEAACAEAAATIAAWCRDAEAWAAQLFAMAENRLSQAATVPTDTPDPPTETPDGRLQRDRFYVLSDAVDEHLLALEQMMLGVASMAGNLGGAGNTGGTGNIGGTAAAEATQSDAKTLRSSLDDLSTTVTGLLAALDDMRQGLTA